MSANVMAFFGQGMTVVNDTTPPADCRQLRWLKWVASAHARLDYARRIPFDQWALGTMVGLYETAVAELSTWQLNGKSITPKIVASTATVRKAEDQVRNVFMRRLAIFPPFGLDIEDNFFSIQRPLIKNMVDATWVFVRPATQGLQF